jgi:mRNA-degrading endonuclease RelE of RelBE toxin-antitoxin system
VRRVYWSPRAEKDLAGLEVVKARRVLAGVERFASSGVGDVKQLQGELAGTLRLRVGDLRVVFEWTVTSEIRVVRIVDRKDAYR